MMQLDCIRTRMEPAHREIILAQTKRSEFISAFVVGTDSRKRQFGIEYTKNIDFDKQHVRIVSI